MLRSDDLQLAADISGQPINTIFKGQAARLLSNATDGLSWTINQSEIFTILECLTEMISGQLRTFWDNLLNPSSMAKQLDPWRQDQKVVLKHL